MTTAIIRQKLHEYINIAGDKKVEAIYTMVADEISEKLELWEDEKFLSELDRRVHDFEKGDVKCSTWDEVKFSTPPHSLGSARMMNIKRHLAVVN